MNREVLSKMKEARKLDKEALMLLLPQSLRGHVEIIEKEMKAILWEGISACISECSGGNSSQKTTGEASKGKVNKVDIE